MLLDWIPPVLHVYNFDKTNPNTKTEKDMYDNVYVRGVAFIGKIGI